MDEVAEVKSRLDIVEVVGGYVPLKQAGRNLKSPCPFHDEKSASFMVSPEKGIYHCFGCGKSGDVITFIMETEGKAFIEVVKELARRAGIDLPEPEQSPAERDASRRMNAERSTLTGVLQLASDFGEIVDFSVKHDAQSTITRNHGLKTTRNVNNCQAALRQMHAVGRIVPVAYQAIRSLPDCRAIVPDNFFPTGHLGRPFRGGNSSSRTLLVAPRHQDSAKSARMAPYSHGTPSG